MDKPAIHRIRDLKNDLILAELEYTREAMDIAIGKGQYESVVEIINELKERPHPLNDLNAYQKFVPYTWVAQAAANLNVDIIELLIDEGIEVTAIDSGGHHALSRFANNQHGIVCTMSLDSRERYFNRQVYLTKFFSMCRLFVNAGMNLEHAAEGSIKPIEFVTRYLYNYKEGQEIYRFMLASIAAPKTGIHRRKKIRPRL